MEPTEAPVSQSRKKVSTFFVWMFAFVGFLAALTQISSFFKTDGSQLQVRVTPHEAVIQEMVSEAVEDTIHRRGFAARTVAADEQFFCDQKGVPENAKKTVEDRCQDYTGLEAILELLRLNDGRNKYFDYELQNVGTTAARQVRLSGKEINLVELIREETKPRQIRQTEGQGYYLLPDLNPGEKIAVRVWSEDFRVDPTSEYLSVGDLPQITFEGGQAATTMYRLAPKTYADLHDILNDFPTPISVILVLAICTAIGIAVIIFISIISALLSGQAVTKIFQQPSKTGLENASQTGAEEQASA